MNATWKTEHSRLWRELVPDSGQASTVQGELVRITGKLTDEAYRNGNLNWGSDCERMWRWVGEKLGDGTFSTEETRKIRREIDSIVSTPESPDLSREDESGYYFLSKKVVEWCIAHPTLLPHQVDPLVNR